MVPIKEYGVYNERMQKSLADKLFWLDKVDVESVVDYGCAGGSLLRELERSTSLKTVGYDIDEKMVVTAQEECNAFCSLEWEECLSKVDVDKSILNVSSVIHEVYSYAETEGDIEVFWSRVFDTGFKYIAIRDMCVDEVILGYPAIQDAFKVRTGTDLIQLEDFERHWGRIDNQRNLIHYLLKYKYRENWSREVKENYLPLTYQQLISMVPTDKYEVLVSENYTLPYLKEQVRTDFAIDLIDATHVKLLLRRK